MHEPTTAPLPAAPTPAGAAPPSACAHIPAFFGQTIHKTYTKGNLGFDFSGVILLVRERLDLRRLRRAISAVLKKYQALRLFFTDDGRGNYPGYVSEDMDTDQIEDLCYAVRVESGPGDGPIAAIEAAAQRIASDIDLFSRRPLLRIVVFDPGPDHPNRVLVAIHHFVCDGISNQMVWREIARHYRAFGDGAYVSRPPLGTELAALSDFLQRQARRVTPASLAYWLNRPAELLTPPGCAEGDDSFGVWRDSETKRVALTGGAFDRFVAAGKSVFRCSTAELLLAVYIHVLAEWMGRGWVAVANWTTGHLAARGLFPMDEAVGCFAFPAFTYFYLEPNRSLVDSVVHARHQQLEAFEHVLDFSVCRFLELDRSAPAPPILEQVRRLPMPHFTFCYMGEFKTDLTLLDCEVAPERVSSYVDANSLKYSLFDLDADLSGAGLFIDLNYPKAHETSGVLALLCRRIETLVRDVEGVA
jgi:Condensation domain